MKLKLLAKHFKDTKYCNRLNPCAIDKALIELLPKNIKVNERGWCVDINKITYEHVVYDEDDFSADKKRAASHKYDNTVIRVINIPKLNI